MTYPPGGQPPYQGPQYPHQPEQPTGYPPPTDYPPAEYPPAEPPQAGAPAPQPAKKTKIGLIVGLVAVVLLALGGAVVIGAVLTAQGKGPLASDGKRIELAIRDFYGTLESHGFKAAAAKACAADRAEFDALPAPQREEFAAATISVTIDKIENIVITGDAATAHIVGTLTLLVPGQEPDTDTSTTEHLKKENGQWKVCSAGSGAN